jgi:N-acetylornithine carbamoyltransferase
VSLDLRGRDLVSVGDLSGDEIDQVLRTAAAMEAPLESAPLRGVAVALVFLNPSLRTRLAAETALAELGGHGVVLSPGQDAWKWEMRDGAVMDGDAVEHVRDAVGTIALMVRGVAIRCFAGMRSWEEDAAERVLGVVRDTVRRVGGPGGRPRPVLSLESATDHPLQSLADLLALRTSLGDGPDADLRGRRFALTWAPHPRPLPMAVPHAALRAAAAAGMRITVCCPEGYEPDAGFLAGVREKAGAGGGGLEISRDRLAGLRGAEAVYGKSWGAPSLYGRWEEEKPLRARHRDWTVDRERMAAAAPGARFLHCLPMRRNVEATDEVVDGPGSLVRQQAYNRLLVQKAVFLETLSP